MKRRIILYSHDTNGLGHTRRNLLIAQALSLADANADILLITGTREFGSFLVPAGVDCLVLPSLYKKNNGQFRARHMNISLKEIVSLRSQVLYAAIANFDPDIFIVDCMASGALGELLPALNYLQSETNARCILGLRDICDSPQAVRHDWRNEGTLDILRRYYHDIWVYGDPAVYDPVHQYDFPRDIAAKVRFTGYLDQRKRLSSADQEKTALDHGEFFNTPYLLCMLGGGQDGAQLARAFCESELPAGMKGVLLCGPHMKTADRLQLHQCTRQNQRLSILDFIPEPAQLVRGAAAIICMGGYNSVCEALSYNKRVLIVPRVRPTEEQLIRARRLKQMNIVNMLRPDMLNGSALSEYIEPLLNMQQPDVHQRIDFLGLKRLPAMVKELPGSPVAGLPRNSDRAMLSGSTSVPTVALQRE